MMLAIVLAGAVASLLIGATTAIEQVVIAQNMTGNMTTPSENMTGSGSISGLDGGGGGGGDSGGIEGGGGGGGSDGGGSDISGGGGGGGGGSDGGMIIITH